MMKRICISEFMDPVAVQALAPGFDLRYEPGWVDRRNDLMEVLDGAHALIVRNRTQVDAALLAAAPGLRVVGRLGVGLDNIDVAACRERGIRVIPAAGANARSVAEYVVTTAAMLLRGAYLSSAEVAAGKWPRTRLSEGRETLGKTLGLIGFGDIGRQAAALAQAFGMDVIAHDPMLPESHAIWAATGVRCVPLDALLAQADAVSLHVPLIDATRNLIDVGRLAAMKPGAVLINTARGGVVDEGALADALRAGHVGGAALDVFADEPLREGGPLSNIPNLILTPHIGGVTREANARVSMMIAREVRLSLEAIP